MPGSSLVGMNYYRLQPYYYPYIGRRFPLKINGLYSLNNLGQLSVKPHWIDTKYLVSQNVKTRLRSFQNI